MKKARIVIELPLPDAAEREDALALGNYIASRTLASAPGRHSDAGPMPVGEVVETTLVDDA